MRFLLASASGGFAWPARDLRSAPTFCSSEKQVGGEGAPRWAGEQRLEQRGEFEERGDGHVGRGDQLAGGADLA
jgi:hypothetical protein